MSEYFYIAKSLFILCVISGFLRGVKKIFALLECYAAYIGSYWRFGTNYLSHLRGSTSPRRILIDIAPLITKKQLTHNLFLQR